MLCAGLGTRLRPLTERFPKPAVPFLGAPLLRTTLAVLKKGGVTALGINTHHLPEVMARTAQAEATRAGMALTVVQEPEIQGTGGGIRGLRALLEPGGTFVVFNGDILFPLDVASVVAEHRLVGAAATMVLMPLPVGEKYAAVECDAQSHVRRIAGHGPGGPQLTPWHFTGVHVMEPEVFRFMTATGPEDINRQVYPRLLGAGLRIHGARRDGYWSDLGTPGRYLDTVEDVLGGKVDLSSLGDGAPLHEAREIAKGVWARGQVALQGVAHGPVLLEDGARVEAGAEVGPFVQLGPRVQVSAGSRVSRSVVLDGTLRGESVTREILWSAGRMAG